jgi:putative ABC transport system permease protein
MTDFVNGSYTITDGEVSDDFTSNDCVINSELAELNDLSVGDTITLQSANDEDLTYDLVITGIFTDSSEATTDMRSMYSSSVNKIITNANLVAKIVADDEDAQTTITPTFVLKNKEVVDSFTAEVTKKGLDENYQVTTNLDTIESETESITNVSSFATTFLIVTLVIGGVVLLILNMINIRERKYEIGVLRTIGMKKSSVTLQFAFELLVISIIGLLFGAAIGAASSVKVANAMLASEIASAKAEQEEIMGNFGGANRNSETKTTDSSSDDVTDTTANNNVTNGVVKISEVTNINAVVDFKVLMELLAIGLGLTLFSSLSAMISIARFSPLAILRERS